MNCQTVTNQAPSIDQCPRGFLCCLIHLTYPFFSLAGLTEEPWGCQHDGGSSHWRCQQDAQYSNVALGSQAKATNSLSFMLSSPPITTRKEVTMRNTKPTNNVNKP
ncbi:hypothetical protein E2C01_005507 [Portunus trituberculatus]|uniref:Uncharacterized protein n=1 Tax=Portunus trituberculatus TaxID=210409 RepID=A0A5B7CUJ7_PORTR|nr:hypothetical protein [Portunus trituberculatus]